MHIHHKRDMDEGKVLRADTELELAHSFDKWGGFYVTNGATQLYGSSKPGVKKPFLMNQPL